MTQPIEHLREQNRNRLIGLALEHLQLEGIASATIPIPGGNRVIAIGAPAQVRALLAPIPPLTAPAPLTDELRDLWIHEDMDRDAADAALKAPRKDLQAAHKQAVEDLLYWKRRALTAEAAPAPQQSGLSDEDIEEIAVDYYRATTDSIDDVIGFARAIEYRAKAEPAAPVQTAEPIAEFADDFIFCLRKQPNGERWPVGTKLYAAPVAAPVQAEQIIVDAQDLMKLARRLIAEQMSDCDEDFMAGRAHGIGSLHSEILTLSKRTQSTGQTSEGTDRG